MKKIVLVAAILTISSSAMAQLLPVLGTVGTTHPEDTSLIVGGAIHTGDSGISVYGIRGTYCPIEDFLLMADLAFTSTEFDNDPVSAPGAGVAAQISLAKVEFLPVDVALRVGYGAYDLKLPVNSSSINAMLLFSGESDDIKGLAAYGGLGAAYWQQEDLDLSILVNLGLRYTIPWVDMLSIDGEVTYVSGNVNMDVGFGFGIACAF